MEICLPTRATSPARSTRTRTTSPTAAVPAKWTVHFAGACAVGDVVHVRVERAGLVALVGSEVAVIDATAHRPPPPPRTRLAVVSA